MFHFISELDVVSCKKAVTHIACWMLLAWEDWSPECVISTPYWGTTGSAAWKVMECNAWKVIL